MKWFLVWVYMAANGGSFATMNDYPYSSFEECQGALKALETTYGTRRDTRGWCAGNQVAFKALQQMVTNEHLSR